VILGNLSHDYPFSKVECASRKTGGSGALIDS